MSLRLLQSIAIAFTQIAALASLAAQNALVEPYLQAVANESAVVMWETDSGDSSVVRWGLTADIPETSYGSAEVTTGSAYLHTVKITGLNPGTRYFYSARSSSWESDTFNFITPPSQSLEQGFRIIAMSDMQKDGGNPQKFDQIVHEGIMDYFDTVYAGDLNEEAGMVLIPGDLVANGLIWSQWRADFFAQSHPLFSYVPVYPVPGNHEFNAAQFFKYFDLPVNGTPGYEEHWWYKDFSNVRVLGMDSNGSYRIQEQLDWLDDVLAESCNDTFIDFVFVQLHHPYKSELWLPGEIDYTGNIVSKLEQFSSDCDKPSIHFFGHTHAYSRGQSRDHQHLWVNVATAGGNIDYWGEYAQNDYDEFVVSQDEYGFVIVEVTAGESPSFTLRRISIGDEFETKDNSLEDQLVIRTNNLQPYTPFGLFPAPGDTLAPDCIRFVADTFLDPDGNTHSATHWQISADSNSFDTPLRDVWKQDKNWYFDINTQEGDDLTDEVFEMLPQDTALWWRVRYRDDGLKWSDWSSPSGFFTSSTIAGENLVQNGNAESGIGGWTIQTGTIESLGAGECSGIDPYAGSKYFAVGALCEEYPFASVYQDIDITSSSAEIDSGLLNVVFGGALADWNGSDIPSFAIQFLDVAMSVIGSSDTTSYVGSWNVIQSQEGVPGGTRHLRLILMGTRQAGVDNDSYFDEVFCRLQPAEECEIYEAPGSIYNRLYVKPDAPGYPNGESWDKAYHTLTDALEDAGTDISISEIWVASNIYRPSNTGDRSATFMIRPGLRVFGGFAGNEESLNQRNPDLNLTYLDGNIGDPEDSTDNSFHIVTISQTTDTIVLDGFIIENGFIDDSSGIGAAMIVNSPPGVRIRLSNLVVMNNFSSNGGAIFNSANILLNQCEFKNNSSLEAVNSIINAGGIIDMIDVSFDNDCGSCNGEIMNLLNGQILNSGNIELSRQ